MPCTCELFFARGPTVKFLHKGIDQIGKESLPVGSVVGRIQLSRAVSSEGLAGRQQRHLGLLRHCAPRAVQPRKRRRR